MQKSVWFNDAQWKQHFAGAGKPNRRLAEILSRYQHLIYGVDLPFDEQEWQLLGRIAATVLENGKEFDFQSYTPLHLRLAEAYRRSASAGDDLQQANALWAKIKALNLNALAEIALIERIEETMRKS